MPSLSPGSDDLSSFERILPGAPKAGTQSITTFIYRWKRYILYISTTQVNILRSPTELVQAISFEGELVSVRAEGDDAGRFALASADNVWILRPVTSSWNRVSWVQELLLNNNNTKNEIRTLSWGTEGELLVAGTQQLALYGTMPSSQATSPAADSENVSRMEARDAHWTKPIACPARFAAFSPSCGLIATSGDTDRLVKVWRRLSFEEAIFDFAYLPHDGTVTHAEWRPAEKEKLEPDVDSSSIKSYHGDEHREVLFTISSDGNLRIWRTNSHNDPDMLSLYTMIDLVSAIPHSPLLTTHGASQRPARYAFIIPSSLYSVAISAALKKHPRREVKHSIEHLKEVASKEPDVVVALDAHGRMSAWGLSSLGIKRRPISGSEAAKAPFHIAHSESMGLECSPAVSAAFETWFDGDVLNIIAHSFGESVKWWRGTVENFSSSSALDFERGEQIAHWQGSSAPIAGLRTVDESRLISWTTIGSAVEWSTSDNGGHWCGTMHADIDKPILDAEIVQRHEDMLVLSEDDVTLAPVQHGRSAVSSPHLLAQGSRLSVLRTRSSHRTNERYIVYNHIGQYVSVLVNLSSKAWTITVSASAKDLPLGTDLEDGPAKFIQTGAVAHPRKSDWLRLAGIDANGLLYRRDVSCAALDDADSMATEDTSRYPTGIKAGSMTMTSDCAAVLSLDKHELVILALTEGYVEHRQGLTSPAQSLVFPCFSEDISTLTAQSLIAISYGASIDILAQSRYEHQQSGGPSHWTTIKHISIGAIGLSISSMAWLTDGQLAIAAGNCIFISDDKISKGATSDSIRQQLQLTDDSPGNVQRMIGMIRGPLTCWQPQVLRELILHGHLDGVVEILVQLQTKLKFYTNGDELDALLGMDIDQLLMADKLKSEVDLDFSELNDQLDEVKLPFTSNEDQEKLKLVATTVSYVARHRHSLDANAIRYLAHWRYHVLLDVRDAQHATANGYQSSRDRDYAVDSSTYKASPMMGWREINFAYQSQTQQPLLELLIQYHENKLDWPTVRALGITLWLHTIKAAQSEGANIASVEQVLDAVGQSAYRSSHPPDPADASLFLLALRKKAVLLSLWRVAVGNREQKSTQNFLRRDFEVQENKTAARKNAYALMGKRRFQYAAAFFLLADDIISAISILAGQCEDLHLAVSVARAYCGDDSPTLLKFVQERVVPDARNSANRWLLAWSHAITGNPNETLRALLVDVGHIVDAEETRLLRVWQQDDPVALTFYRELRDDPKRKSPLSKTIFAYEYRAVLRTARVLRRMGFWLLALKFARYWTFMQPGVEASQAVEVDEAEIETISGPNRVPSLLDRFESTKEVSTVRAPIASAPSMLDSFGGADDNTSSIMASTNQNEADERAAKAAALLAKMRARNAAKKSDSDSPQNDTEKDQKKPTQFSEPAASSILDSFGF